MTIENFQTFLNTRRIQFNPGKIKIISEEKFENINKPIPLTKPRAHYAEKTVLSKETETKL